MAFYQNIQDQNIIINGDDIQFIHMIPKWLMRTLYWSGNAAIRPFMNRHVERISQKINIETNEKLKFLQKNQCKDLEDYFVEKNVCDFQIEDFYFYITRKEMFVPINFFIKLDMINNPNIATYEKFWVAFSTDAFKETKIQSDLILAFNENCYCLDNPQFAFCLENIIEFQDFSQKIDLQVLRNRVTEIEMDEHYFQILYYLTYFQETKLLDQQKILKKIQSLEEQPEIALSIKDIYYMKKIEKKLNLQPSSKMQVDRIHQLEKKLKGFSQEESQYIVALLQFYPQYTYIIKVEKLTKHSYVEYLTYLKNRAQGDENFVIIPHPFPKSLLTECKHYQFSQITKLRMEMEIESPRNLAKNFNQLLTHDLECVYSIIQYFHEQEEQDDYVWMHIEQTLFKAFQMHYRTIFVQKLFKKYELSAVIRIISKMAFYETGSKKFWRGCMVLFNKIMENPSVIEDLDHEDQNNFIINCFSATKVGIINDFVQKKLIDLALIALARNRWPIKTIHALATCLFKNRIGEDVLWYGIEQKILAINFKKIKSPFLFEKLKKIGEIFAKMRKGTFMLWRSLDEMNLYETDSVYPKIQKAYIPLNDKLRITMKQDK